MRFIAFIYYCVCAGQAACVRPFRDLYAISRLRCTLDRDILPLEIYISRLFGLSFDAWTIPSLFIVTRCSWTYSLDISSAIVCSEVTILFNSWDFLFKLVWKVDRDLLYNFIIWKVFTKYSYLVHKLILLGRVFFHTMSVSSSKTQTLSSKLRLLTDLLCCCRVLAFLLQNFLISAISKLGAAQEGFWNSHSLFYNWRRG